MLSSSGERGIPHKTYRSPDSDCPLPQLDRHLCRNSFHWRTCVCCPGRQCCIRHEAIAVFGRHWWHYNDKRRGRPRLIPHGQAHVPKFRIHLPTCTWPLLLVQSTQRVVHRGRGVSPRVLQWTMIPAQVFLEAGHKTHSVWSVIQCNTEQTSVCIGIAPTDYKKAIINDCVDHNISVF